MVKLGRNDSCHCGSGKKYKKCCSEKDLHKPAFAITDAASKHEPAPRFEAEDGADYQDHATSSEYRPKIENEGEVENEGGTDNELDSTTSAPYPTISDSEEELVDQWWHIYKTLKGAGATRNHLDNFTSTYPHLVENLGLEYEVLFELGADYIRVGKLEEYILLLITLRNQFPSMYVRSAGHHDSNIIAWLVGQKRENEIEHYLNYFIAFPVTFVEQFFEVINLLLATDNTKALFLLLYPVANKILLSPDIIGGDEILVPILIDKLSNYLKPGYTENDIEHFIEGFDSLIHINDTAKFKNHWYDRCNSIFKPFAPWPDTIPSKRSKLDALYWQISYNFMRYLHESTGISWVCANYYSNLVNEYLTTVVNELHGKMPKHLFDFSKTTLDKTSYKITSKMFMYADYTKAISILNSVYYFSAYLHTCTNITETQKLTIQKDCLELYNNLYPDFKANYAEACCFSEFPSFSKAQSS